MDTSYGIVLLVLKIFIIVNERKGDHVDKVMVIDHDSTTEESIVTVKSYEDINIGLLFDDGHPHATYRMEFTTNHGSVAAARFVNVNGRDLPLQTSKSEHNINSASKIAKFLLWYDSVRVSGFSVAMIFEHSMKISGWNKDKVDIQICVICLQEFRLDEMIGTLDCKHVYHQECIIKWLLKKSACPLCRATVYNYKL